MKYKEANSRKCLKWLFLQGHEGEKPFVTWTKVYTGTILQVIGTLCQQKCLNESRKGGNKWDRLFDFGKKK